MTNGLTFEQRWFRAMDWIAESFAPPFSAFFGAMLIFMSYYGENLYWMADVFQWTGVAAILVGLWWMADIRFQRLEQRITRLENQHRPGLRQFGIHPIKVEVRD